MFHFLGKKLENGEIPLGCIYLRTVQIIIAVFSHTWHCMYFKPAGQMQSKTRDDSLETPLSNWHSPPLMHGHISTIGISTKEAPVGPTA